MRRRWIALLTALLLMVTLCSGIAFSERMPVDQEVIEFNLNAAAWDSAVSTLKNGMEYTTFWNGRNYSFIVGQDVFASFQDAYEESVSRNASSPKVLALPGSHGDITITGKVTLEGFYALVDPNVRGFDQTAAPTLNPQRLSMYESTVGNITVSAGAQGKVTISGLTVTGGFRDSARPVSDVATQVTLKNLIIKQNSSAFSDAVFNIANANNTNVADTGMLNADSFTVQNCRVESITASRVSSNSIAPVTTYDGLAFTCTVPFWGYAQWRRYFSNAVFTMRNCFIANNNSSIFLSMEGLNKYDGSCKIQILNNVFKISASSTDGYLMGMQARAGYQYQITGNIFISSVGPKEPFNFQTDTTGRLSGIIVAQAHEPDLWELPVTVLDGEEEEVGTEVDNTTANMLASGVMTLSITGNRFVKFTKFSYAPYQINANTTINISNNFFTNDGTNYKTATGIAPATEGTGSTTSCNVYYTDWELSALSSTPTATTSSMVNYDTHKWLTRFTISSTADWEKFASLVNDEGVNFKGKTVALLNDLDFGGAQIMPVGGCSDEENQSTIINYFGGTFEGNSHRISNFVIDIEEEQVYGIGLFGAVYKGIVRNLAIENATITGWDKIGGLAGFGDGSTFSNCSADVEVIALSGGNGCAQLVSQARGGATITGCISRGSVQVHAGRACGLSAWGQSTLKIINSVSYSVLRPDEEKENSTILLLHFGRVNEDAFQTVVSNTYASHYYSTDFGESYGGDADDYTVEELAARCGLSVQNGKLVINGRGVAGSSAVVTDSESGVSATYYGAVGDPIGAVLPGYFYIAPATDAHYTAAVQTNLTAHYVPELFTLTLNLDGGTLNADCPSTFTVEDTLDLPEITEVSKTNYLFAGWYKTPDFDSERYTRIAAGTAESVTLYARYVEIAGTISNANELNALAAEVNGGDTKLGKGYVITADFSTYGYGFPGIANTLRYPFEGILYGGYHTIQIGCTNHAVSGLVGALGEHGTVAAIEVTGSVTGYIAGGVVGYNMGGVVRECVFNGTVTQLESSVRVMSQNLLVTSDSAEVNTRGAYLREIVTEYSPDVIGMQEAGPTWISYLNSNFTDYGMVYAYRGAGSVESGSREATPVLYKKSKYNKLDSGRFWLSATPDVMSPCFDDGQSFNRICSWVELQDKTTGEIFFFFSTHFTLTSAARPKCAEVMKKKVKEICGEYMPFYIVGDLNHTRTAAERKILQEFADDQAFLPEDQSELNLRTFTGYHFGSGQPPRDYSDYPSTDGVNGIIDYCFANKKHVVSTSYDVMQLTKNLTCKGTTYVGAPVSDHYGILLDTTQNKPAGEVVGKNMGSVEQCYGNTTAIGADYGITENVLTGDPQEAVVALNNHSESNVWKLSGGKVRFTGQELYKTLYLDKDGETVLNVTYTAQNAVGVWKPEGKDLVEWDVTQDNEFEFTYRLLGAYEQVGTFGQTLNSYSMSLQGDIAARFYMTPDSAWKAAHANAYLRITVDGEKTEYPLASATIDGKGRHVFLRAVSAPQMTSPINLKLFDGDGQFAELGNYTVAEYAQYMFTATDEAFVKARDLVRAMLNYGAATQTYFDLHTDFLANAGNETNVSGVASIDAQEITEGEATGLEPDTACTVVGSRTDLRFFFTTNNKPTDYTFSYVDNGKTIALEPVLQRDGRLLVAITNIPAAYLDRYYTLTAVNKKDNTQVSITYSATCYMSTVLKGNATRFGITEEKYDQLRTIVQAMYLYGQEARLYFNV